MLVFWPEKSAQNRWEVYFHVYEEGKLALDKAGITIPFPQMDVHMNKLEK